MGLITVRGRSWERPSDTNVQPPGSFGGLTFAVLADPQLGLLPQSPPDYQEELMRLNTARVNMEKYSPQFVIVLGDLVQILPDDDRNQEERAVQTRKIHDALRTFPAHIPVFVLCGNHDVGNAPTEESLRHYQELWGVPRLLLMCTPHFRLLVLVFAQTAVFKKTGKKGRKEFTQLEIFRMREKDIPVDNVQLPDVAVQLHWEEGYSKRFALVVHDEQSSNQALRFYRVCDASEDGKRDTILIYSFDISGYMNYMKWSPFGSYFILASLGLEGSLLFCCLNEQDIVQVSTC
eukprot:XP_028346126.1 uncharacterized protein LOC114486388 [Physeter catodon]